VPPRSHHRHRRAGLPGTGDEVPVGLTGEQFILAGDLIEATSDTGAYVLLSGVLKRTSAKLTKICNDIRMLASGRAALQTRSTCRRCSRAPPSCPQGQSGDPGVVNQTGFSSSGRLTVTLAPRPGSCS